VSSSPDKKSENFLCGCVYLAACRVAWRAQVALEAASLLGFACFAQRFHGGGVASRLVLCKVYFTLCWACLTLSPMNKSEAVAFFGSQAALAKALGVSRSSVSEWHDVPVGRQYQLEVITRGALKAEHEELLGHAEDLPCREATS